MVKCKNCGEEIEEKKFCPNCGTKNETIVCPNCKSELDEENIFCPECGTKIKNDEENEKVNEDKKESEEPEEDKNQKKPESPQEEPTKENEPEEDKNQEKPVKKCPYCNAELDDEDIEFCTECGKQFNIDMQSFEGIKITIQAKNVVIFSIISIIFSTILSIIFSFILGNISQTTDLYPIGFFISLLIIVGIFGSFKDLINGGLVGIITGLVLGLICNAIVELTGGFTFSYEMFYGYAPIVFTIFGAIVGVLSTKYLRKSIMNYIDVEKLF